MEKTKANPPKTSYLGGSPWYVARQVGELGFVIAIPLVVLVLLGHWLDVKLGFKAVFVLLAIPISLVFSGYIIYRKIRSINH